ncbi:hypothetical protein WR25_14288 [Diploscapter pachys]|uniref:Cyclin C-terminal domain-containing protein n=1 Tax=Diploscapter pachys TaxID=2018661 RepID=A0A2A2KH40_9BILA|nr:hypothetical protein WR25_14288 [Diploscapter pachys]
MYSTSTQKRSWTFTPEAIQEKRNQTNEQFREKHRILLEPGEEEFFLTSSDELLMQRMIEHAALTFAESFRPHIFSSIKWTAYAYFKRAFLGWSVMDFSPKIVMMACFYVAMKTDEFFVTIDDFVGNLKTGTIEGNISRILGLEPEILQANRYHLTVHCPYRPFEGHMMDIKKHIPHLGFDVESIRQDAYKFFDECLISDAMVLYSPSHIALAAILYGLSQQNREVDILRDALSKVLGVQEDPWNGKNPEEMSNVDRLLNKISEIVARVTSSHEEFDANYKLHSKSLMKRSNAFAELNKNLGDRKANHPVFAKKEQPVDSDDD